MQDDWDPTRRDILRGAAATAGALGGGISSLRGMGGVEAAATNDSGTPMELPDVAALAKEVGNGQPLTVLDLAALDRNIDRVVSEVQERGWAARPALKSFRSPEFSAYVLSRLPEPRGLVFHLRAVPQLLGILPENPDLMLGYAPTKGELADYFASTGADEPPHRLRLLLDDPDLVRICAELARNGKRDLPVEVALEFDSGMQRGGIKNEAELSEAIEILRENQDVLRLTATMCYDGHATVQSRDTYREAVAEDAQRRYREFLAQLREEGGDLYDEDELVRNGPGSSNYQNWDPEGPATEVSPGTAFVFHGYLTADGFDNEGLVPTLLHGAPVNRIPADGPRTPLLGIEPPWDETDPEGTPAEGTPADGYEEVLVKGGAWPSNEGDLAELVWPEGMRDDPSSGGRGNNTSALLAPEDTLDFGDYVLLRPQIAGDGISYFGALHATREGEVKGVWPTRIRWQRPSQGQSLEERPLESTRNSPF